MRVDRARSMRSRGKHAALGALSRSRRRRRQPTARRARNDESVRQRHWLGDRRLEGLQRDDLRRPPRGWRGRMGGAKPRRRPVALRRDGRWRYGGTDGALFQSIFYGRPKGMPAYGGVMSPGAIWKVITYLKAQPIPNGVPTERWPRAGEGKR